MSQTGPGPDEHADDEAFFGTPPPEGHHHWKPHRPRGRGCLPMLLLLVVILGAAWFGGRFAYDEIKSRFAPPPDYAGPGNGAVLYQVKSGATSTRIGQELKQFEEHVLGSPEVVPLQMREPQVIGGIDVEPLLD